MSTGMVILLALFTFAECARVRLGKVEEGKQLAIVPSETPGKKRERQTSPLVTMQALETEIASANIVFFDSAFCPFCREAEAALTKENLQFKKVPIAEFKAALKEKTGKTSAPSVWVKGFYIGGCNDGTEPWHGVKPCIKSGKIKQLLLFAMRTSSGGAAAAPSTAALDAEIASADVVFFDMASCPFCRDAESALTRANIPFKKVPVGAFKAALKERTGKTSAPSVWVKGTYIGGCNDGTKPWHGVKPCIKSGKIKELLNPLAMGTSSGGEAGGTGASGATGSAPSSQTLDAEIASADVVFFDLASCPFCREAESALTQANIPFKKVPIGVFKAALKEKTGKTSAPSVWVKGTYIGGCNDGTESWHGVKPCIASGKIKDLLN